MLARRKAKLPFYLNALREKEYAEKYPGCLLNNFHNLLRFWQRHYLNKDKDSTCLENVSSCHCFLFIPRVACSKLAEACGFVYLLVLRMFFIGDVSGLTPWFPPQSSCVPFSYWKETVSVLLGSDRTSLCAIVSYIDEPFMDLDRDLLDD